MKLLDLNTKNIVNLEVLPGEIPLVVKWCPKKPGVAAIGYKSGRVSFVDINSQKSFSIEKFTNLQQEDFLYDSIKDLVLSGEE